MVSFDLLGNYLAAMTLSGKLAVWEVSASTAGMRRLTPLFRADLKKTVNHMAWRSDCKVKIILLFFVCERIVVSCLKIFNPFSFLV